MIFPKLLLVSKKQKVCLCGGLFVFLGIVKALADQVEIYFYWLVHCLTLPHSTVAEGVNHNPDGKGTFACPPARESIIRFAGSFERARPAQPW